MIPRAKLRNFRGDLSIARKLVAPLRAGQLKDGESFPAIMGAEDGGIVQVFDLTAPPAVPDSRHISWASRAGR
jgi:hypothetical protein